MHRGGHDDLINAAAGALVRAAQPSSVFVLDMEDPAASPALNPYQQQIARVYPEVFEQPTDLTCGQCLYRTGKLRGTAMHAYCEERRLWIKDQDIICDIFDLKQ